MRLETLHHAYNLSLPGVSSYSDTFSIISNAYFGRMASWSATYSTARAGTGSTSNNTGQLIVGQYLTGGTYYLYQSLLAFDTTSIPSEATVTSAIFSAYPSDVGTAAEYTMNLRLVPGTHGASYWWDSGTDWLAGADASGETLLASLPSTSWVAGAYRTWNDVAFASGIQKEGYTWVYLTSSLFESGTAPTGDERMEMDVVTNLPQLEVHWNV